MLEKKLLIAIPTYNRPQIVSYLMDRISPIIDTTKNLYMKIYDSSDDSATESIVIPYVNDKIGYKRYRAGLADEKGLDILREDGGKYDFIWFCSDRKVLKLNSLIPLIEEDINCNVDFILFDKTGCNETRREIRTLEEIGLLFFEITNLAKTIVGSRIIQYMAQEDIYNKYVGSHFSIQASMMDYFGCNSFCAVQYKLRDQDIAETGRIPFKHEWSANTVWQWSKSWCDTVDAFPDSYNNLKSEIIKKNSMFRFKKVLARRANGAEYKFSDIKQYKCYIKRVKSNIISLYLANCIPRTLLRSIYKVYKILKNMSSKTS